MTACIYLDLSRRLWRATDTMCDSQEGLAVHGFERDKNFFLNARDQRRCGVDTGLPVQDIGRVRDEAVFPGG